MVSKIMKLKLDEKIVRELKHPSSGQRMYFDTKIPGFGVCVGSKTKTFFIQRQKHGKTIRTKIGRYGEYNFALARSRALELGVDIQQGINPNQQRQIAFKSNITLNELYDRYSASLRANKKNVSLSEYPKILKRHFPDWLQKPIADITREMIVSRHSRISKDHGKSIANKSCRILRAIFNYQLSDDYSVPNPVKILTDKKLWFSENRRTNRLKPHEIKLWFNALQTLPNEILQHLFTFILFNGIRKREALRLAWPDIDFENRSFIIRHTKNKKSLELPMTDFTESILRKLYQKRINQWVFPSETSRSGHIEEPKKAIHVINQKTNLNVTIHDLRRTFVSIANSINITTYTLKRIINHSTSNDVTAIYVILDLDDLRQPLALISNYMLDLIHSHS